MSYVTVRWAKGKLAVRLRDQYRTVRWDKISLKSAILRGQAHRKRLANGEEKIYTYPLIAGRLDDGEGYPRGHWLVAEYHGGAWRDMATHEPVHRAAYVRATAGGQVFYIPEER